MELQLKNIGMIKEANIKIDGLTVIAGENDTGKSTVGKALYIMLYSSTYRPTESFNPSIDWERDAFIVLVKSMIKNIFEVPLNDNSFLELKIENNIFSIEKEKTFNYIGKLSKEERNVIFIETPLVWNFSEFFRDIALIESQMKIEVAYPYLMKDLNFKLFIKNASNSLDIKEKVTSLMGGEFKKDEMGRYYFDKKGKRIELVNTATGIKYFGIFQVLSQNNYLNKNSILVLDEPEVHLHPKWQLEMAKIIVELVKNGVKIVLNSHSPYMIEALELYSSKEKINRNFYLAEKKDNFANIFEVTDNLEPIYAKLAKPIQELEEESLESFEW